MTIQPLVLKPEQIDQPLDVLGMRISVLADNHSTGSYEITLQEGDSGMGPPPHSHAWDESFYVLDGEIEFHCGDVSEICGPGTLVHVPANTVHAFRFTQDGGRMLELSGNGGNASRTFTAVSREIPPGPPNLELVRQVFQINGVTLQV